MIKKLLILSILLILNNCSFDTKSGIWTEEKIKLGKEENKDIKELFKKEILNENEFNPNLKLEIKNFSENKNKYKGNNFGALKVSSIETFYSPKLGNNAITFSKLSPFHYGKLSPAVQRPYQQYGSILKTEGGYVPPPDAPVIRGGGVPRKVRKGAH